MSGPEHFLNMFKKKRLNFVTEYDELIKTVTDPADSISFRIEQIAQDALAIIPAEIKNAFNISDLETLAIDKLKGTLSEIIPELPSKVSSNLSLVPYKNPDGVFQIGRSAAQNVIKKADEKKTSVELMYARAEAAFTAVENLASSGARWDKAYKQQSAQSKSNLSQAKNHMLLVKASINVTGKTDQNEASAARNAMSNALTSFTGGASEVALASAAKKNADMLLDIMAGIEQLTEDVKTGCDNFSSLRQSYKDSASTIDRKNKADAAISDIEGSISAIEQGASNNRAAIESVTSTVVGTASAAAAAEQTFYELGESDLSSSPYDSAYASAVAFLGSIGHYDPNFESIKQIVYALVTICYNIIDRPEISIRDTSLMRANLTSLVGLSIIHCEEVIATLTDYSTEVPRSEHAETVISQIDGAMGDTFDFTSDSLDVFTSGPTNIINSLTEQINSISATLSDSARSRLVEQLDVMRAQETLTKVETDLQALTGTLQSMTKFITIMKNRVNTQFK